MQKIEYGDIIKQSWNIVSKHRFLWLLGFFVAMGSGFSFYSSFDQKNSDNADRVVADFFQSHFALGVSLVIFLLLLSIVIYVVSIYCKAALIKAINDVEIYSQLKVTKLIAAGKPYFWRLFLLEIVFSLAMMSIFFILAVPTASLFYLKAYVLGSFVALSALAILLPVLVAAHFTKKYAVFYVVLAEMRFRKAIEFAYMLFNRTIKESILMMLISIGLGILISVCFAAIMIIVVFVLVALGFLLYWLFQKGGIYVAVGIGAPLLLVLTALFSGICQAYFFAVWVNFYKYIASIKKEDPLVAAAKELKIETSVPNPEAV